MKQLTVMSKNRLVCFDKNVKMLINWYKSFKNDYLNRDPRGKWEFVRSLGQYFLTLTGIPIIDRNFKTNWFSYALFVAIADVAFSFLYTVWYFHNTPIKSILTLSLSGIMIPVIEEHFFPNGIFIS